MKLVVCGRRFPGVTSNVRSSGNFVCRPGARIWNNPIGVGRSRSRRRPRSTNSTPLSSVAVDSARRT